MSRKASSLDSVNEIFLEYKNMKCIGVSFETFQQLATAIHKYTSFITIQELNQKSKACLLGNIGNKPLKYYTKPKYNFWGSV
nr:hypothetical protein [Staphylococcus chromogenes]